MTKAEARQVSAGVAAGILRGWSFQVDPTDVPSAEDRCRIEGEFRSLVYWLDWVAQGGGQTVLSKKERLRRQKQAHQARAAEDRQWDRQPDGSLSSRSVINTKVETTPADESPFVQGSFPFDP